MTVAKFFDWRIVILLLASFVVIPSCKNDNLPDVSNYHAETIVRRFDNDFFSIDTNQLDQSLNQLNTKYPDFFPDYLTRILGINPSDPQSADAIKAFYASYQPIYKNSKNIADKHLPTTIKEIEQGLKYMQYYFPGWKPDSPFVITTFIGPMDAFEPFSIGDYGDVRTRDGVGIALQLHLGASDDIYMEGRNQGVFYDYQIARFTPEMMTVNSIKNIIDDEYPYTSSGKTLIEEMVEKGKRLYVLDQLLPTTADSLKIGYTGKQLKGCYENEAVIWSFFIKNDLLYSKETTINQLYIKDGPKTQELGNEAPGYIGLFVGRQIVRSYMDKNKDVTLSQLMAKPANEIMSNSGYKP